MKSRTLKLLGGALIGAHLAACQSGPAAHLKDVDIEKLPDTCRITTVPRSRTPLVIAGTLGGYAACGPGCSAAFGMLGGTISTGTTVTDISCPRGTVIPKRGDNSSENGSSKVTDFFAIPEDPALK